MKFAEMNTYIDYCDGCGDKVGKLKIGRPWSAPSGKLCKKCKKGDQ